MQPVLTLLGMEAMDKLRLNLLSNLSKHQRGPLVIPSLYRRPSLGRKRAEQSENSIKVRECSDREKDD